MKDGIKPLSFYLKAHARYILPTWAFPIYFISWGMVCKNLPYSHALVLFWPVVGIPFFGVGLWAAKSRKCMPYSTYVFLTMVIPFTIFVAIALVFAVGQLILESSR